MAVVLRRSWLRLWRRPPQLPLDKAQASQHWRTWACEGVTGRVSGHTGQMRGSKPRSGLQNRLQVLRGLWERKAFNDASTPQESSRELHQQCQAGPHCGPPPADQILGAARWHEPESSLIAAGQACRSLCATGADLPLQCRMCMSLIS